MNKNQIFLAALLHDIGKFWQRADVYNRQEKSWRDLDSQAFKEEVFCPSFNGRYSHKHVLWTAQFIESILGVSSMQDGEDSLIRLAAMHHSETSHFGQFLIKTADHLSSGVDREKINNDIKVEDDWGDWRNTPLLSVFETLGCRESNEAYRYRLPIVPFAISDKIFPKPKEEFQGEKSEYYRALWDDFVNEIKKAQLDLNTRQGAETLFALLKKYTVNVPSSTQDIPDISLFDHSKTVAAFAVSLYEYAQAKQVEEIKVLEKWREDSNEKPFLLYGGDLSGIQKYIYHIKSKHAAKNLKGRSFLLHLITTTVVRKILDETGLYQAHVIYNSGGGFFMLLPNTDEIKQKLENIEAEVEKELLEKFGGKLYLATGQVPFSMPEVFNKQIQKPWRKLFEKLNESKRQRFRKSIENNYEAFFEPFGEAGNIDKDEITGEVLTDFDIEYYNKTGLRVNKITADQARLGTQLKKARYWYIVPNGSKNKEFHIDFLGYAHLFTEEKGKDLYKNEKAVRIRLNDTGFVNPQAKNIQNFEFYGGNDYPVDDAGDPKTFDELTAGNYNKLGIVRMDVDNLGYLFQKGFEQQKRTFSRYASLSRNLDLFFKGYINTLWNSKPEYQKHIFILYSGGDDLFVLGDWNIVREFAEELRNRFRHFVCENPVITLSGGELIVPPKYPILKAAEEAEKPEKAAKSYVYKNLQVKMRIHDEENNCAKIDKPKDAFTFLDTPMGWEAEYYAVKNMAEELLSRIENENNTYKKALPTALLQKLMMYYEKRKEKRSIWLMNYDFGRMIQRYKKDHGAFLEQILMDCLNNTWDGQYRSDFVYSSRKLYAVAARWAELMYRDKKTDKKQLLETDKI